MIEDIGENSEEKRIRDIPVTIKTFSQLFLLVLIRGYQILISPLNPPGTCRFYPSCSHYAYQAIYRFGAIRGTLLGIRRLLRCNPFNIGGFDPVPAEFPHRCSHQTTTKQRA